MDYPIKGSALSRASSQPQPDTKTVEHLADSFDLTDTLAAIGVDSTSVQQLNNEEWGAAALLTSVRVGRTVELPTTGMRVLVASRLATREQVEKQHPLMGLPS